MHFGIVTVQAWLHLLFSLLSTSMLMCAHSTAHLIIYARNLAHASLKTAVGNALATKPVRVGAARNPWSCQDADVM